MNFTVSDFLRRSQNLSILNQIKHEQVNSQDKIKLRFPIHHKHKNDDNLVMEQKLDDVYDINVDQVVANAYEMAINLVRHLNIISILKKKNIFEMNMLSQYIHNDLKHKSKLIDDITTTPNHFNNSYVLEWNMDEGVDDDYDYPIDEDNDDDDNNEEEQDNDNVTTMVNELINLDGDDEPNVTSVREDFKGINIRDDIGIEDIKSYFKIKINDKVKYLHKQSACWLLTDENTHISADRLCHVIETSRSNI